MNSMTALAGMTDPMCNARPPRHSRAELYAALDAYLSALLAQDPTRVTWASVVRNTENNVALMIGDGLWNTITARGEYDLRFADPQTGQVGLFTTVTETDDESAMVLRLGVVEGAIAEVETIVVRQLDSGIKFTPQKFERKPVLETIVPPEEREPRERMVTLANGYFSTLERNDGTLFTRFHPDCNRVENGVQTTNNPDFHVVVSHMPCEAQFRMGNWLYDDRLRGRRYPLIDEERGIIMAAAFIDHCGALGAYKLADGTPAMAKIRRPHTYYLLEIFKIRAGAIEQVEANFITVPYHMPSPWDLWQQ
ncbi:hypothetical protein BH09PSE4_BH09PSE4_00360 [soil metagenome]